MSYREFFASELERFDIELGAAQHSALVTYCEELSRWNKKINLTGLEGRALVRRLVVEPVWIARRLEMQGVLLDIGSGNGSPAFPMHVVAHFRKCELVEARLKRAAFLRHLAGELHLPEISVRRARFEEILPEIESPDWITLQAVALNHNLMDAIRTIAHTTTTVVWITSPAVETDLKPENTLTIPITGTKVLLFS